MGDGWEEDNPVIRTMLMPSIQEKGSPSGLPFDVDSGKIALFRNLHYFIIAFARRPNSFHNQHGILAG